jgi:hypothetical protein
MPSIRPNQSGMPIHQHVYKWLDNKNLQSTLELREIERDINKASAKQRSANTRVKKWGARTVLSTALMLGAATGDHWGKPLIKQAEQQCAPLQAQPNIKSNNPSYMHNLCRTDLPKRKQIGYLLNGLTALSGILGCRASLYGAKAAQQAKQHKATATALRQQLLATLEQNQQLETDVMTGLTQTEAPDFKALSNSDVDNDYYKLLALRGQKIRLAAEVEKLKQNAQNPPQA